MLSDALIASGFNNDSRDQEEAKDTKTIFSKKSAAIKAAKKFDCKGAHKIGDKWMTYKNMDDFNATNSSEWKRLS